MDTFFLGCDASKGYADFVIIDQRKQIVEVPFQLDDTFEGHNQLFKILDLFCQTHAESQLYAGIESTGGYENNWLHALRSFQASLPIQVARINPSCVYSYVRTSRKHCITDAISAASIAEYMVAHGDKIRYHQEDLLAALRRHWTFIQMLTKQRAALLGQLESLLYLAFPELLVYCKNGVSDWLLKLIVSYPSARRVARANAQSMAKIPYISQERAQELIRLAKKSIASLADQATDDLLRATAQQILHMSKVIKKQVKNMTQNLNLPREIELLKSFNGISDYSAVGLLLEIQSVERFASSKKISAFFGVHPVYKISGDGIGCMRMSKNGSSRARALLYMVTLSAIRCNPIIKPLYDRRVAKGMKKMAAIGVCMHKILRIIYGILKNKQPFDPEMDLNNQKRSKPKQVKPRIDRKRRYQQFDKKAPISRRANKRRQQQKSSQSTNGTMCGMSDSAAVSTTDNLDLETFVLQYEKEHL